MQRPLPSIQSRTMNKILLSLSMLCFLVSHPLLAMGAKMSRNAYEQSSLEHLAQRGGVDPDTLDSFYQSLQNTTLFISNKEAALNCLNLLRDFRQARNDLLDCLSIYGRGGLSPELGHALFVERAERLQNESSLESIQSSALVGFLEDLVREKMRLDGHAATWVHRDHGYLKGHQKTDFEFQDGDVVIGLGNSSISSLISQITNTPSRYSHAFIVRIREGQFTTVESLVQTGVREFPLEHLIKDPYNQLTVLRWKNTHDRAQVTRIASDWAQQKALEKTPYDMGMDMENYDKIYCSELIIKAYSHATGLSYDKLSTHRSRMEDDKVYNFAKLIGVSAREYVAPGDLFNSEYFEVVADYRQPSELMRAWDLYLMGDLFIERLKKNHQVVPGPLFTTVPMAAWIAQLLPSLFHSDARLLPESIGPYAMSVMATTELHIYNNVINGMNKQLSSRSLLDHSPWQMRGAMEKSLDTHSVVQISFPIPQNKKRRIGHNNRRLPR
jgi:uncharacterized protein YycO